MESSRLIITLRIGLVADLAGLRFVDPLMRADHERARLVESSLHNGECIVAADGDDLCGFAILNYSFFNQGFVPLLVVAVGNRRSGIGTQLLSEVERRCTRTRLYVSANRSNMPAQWLFEKCGFVPSGHIANLDVGDDEMLFFKPVERLTLRSKERAAT
jgi:GNAT superfamily N-acetyltransferase